MLKDLFNTIFKNFAPDREYGPAYSFADHMQSLAKLMPFPLLHVKSDSATFEPRMKNGRSYLAVVRQLEEKIHIGVFSNIKYPPGCVPSVIHEFLDDKCELDLLESEENALVVSTAQEPISALTALRFAEIVTNLMVNIHLFDSLIIGGGHGQRYR
jgi:hypothetical protein